MSPPRARLLVAAAGVVLAVTPWLTWYTGVEDNGRYSDDGWTAFAGIAAVVAVGSFVVAAAASAREISPGTPSGPPGSSARSR